MTFNVADVQINSKLSHNGDANTFLNFGTDTLGITTGGTERIAVSNTGLDVTGAITVSGLVDGRDVAADGTKLDAIEALADVTDTTNVVAALTAGTNVAIAANGTISATDTNTEYSVGDGGLTQKNFTTALNTKLGAIEALADVTDTVNVVAALTAGTNVAIAANGTISATDTNTEYSVGDGGLTQKNFTTALNTKLGAIEALADVTDTVNVVAALTAGTNVAIASDGTISSTDTNTEYSVGDGGLTQKNFTTALDTKLGAIEALADVTDTANVVAALTAGTNISIASNGTISSAAAYADADVDAYINASILTTDISEGTNLYYTDARADARIGAASIFALTDVASGTVVTNLNADKVDGFHGIGIYNAAGTLLNG
jgi:hypothetical protein